MADRPSIPARLRELIFTRLRALRTQTRSQVRDRFARARAAVRRDGPSQAQFWLIALLVGLGGGAAALGFRLAISSIQTLIYGADDHRLHTTLAGLDPVIVVGVPILGGLAVGVILHLFTADGRAGSVAQVIEAAALRNGRVPIRSGLASAAASLITLSTGGSTGREGPVVHLASVISTWVSDRIHAAPVTARDLLGCAVAAAVAASFNAPIAGALFALEVVLRHFALHAFAPIVIAAIAGTVISRLQMGNVAEFRLPEHSLAFYQELPAFLILGLVSGLAAVAVMKAVFRAESFGDAVQSRLRMPGWLRPGVAGAILGVIALQFPHIIGVGYETTTRVLKGDLGFQDAVVFAVIKAVALAITLAGRMGGGVFSPSLMLGAMTGLAFGHVAVNIFPSVSGSESLYALAGMGAFAAAVLGAPLSTAMIVFELTGDWQAGIAILASVSMATVVSARFVEKSFFLTLLAKRNIRIAGGPESWVPGTIPVRHVLRPRGADDCASDSACWALVEQGARLERTDTLEKALPMFESAKGMTMIPVVETHADGRMDLIGAVYHVDALKAFNRALIETHREEHS
ncbi:MAG: voltage-gated chloride channel [Rhodobacteraceae bacterium]|nr:voltage-gated chloride channel [Paracoccaceae bacterium]MBR28176.1 voltage-gated chloride channel [Paracoccaceae bacterium]